jgi:hypothetical protein
VRISNVEFVPYIETFSTFGVRTAVRRGEVLRNTHGAPRARAAARAARRPRRGTTPRRRDHGGFYLIALAARSAQRPRANGNALVVPGY